MAALQALCEAVSCVDGKGVRREGVALIEQLSMEIAPNHGENGSERRDLVQRRRDK